MRNPPFRTHDCIRFTTSCHSISHDQAALSLQEPIEKILRCDVEHTFLGRRWYEDLRIFKICFDASIFIRLGHYRPISKYYDRILRHLQSEMFRIFHIEIVHQIRIPILLGSDPQEQFKGKFALCRFRFFHPLIHIFLFPPFGAFHPFSHQTNQRHFFLNRLCISYSWTLFLSLSHSLVSTNNASSFLSPLTSPPPSLPPSLPPFPLRFPGVPAPRRRTGPRRPAGSCPPPRTLF